jgi:PHS family inorganic phosphate transporter-like MFS transporter
MCTLFGSVCGQLSFGFLADFYGRTRLYGIELVLVIVSTIGVATSSHGYGDMSFLGLFVWWRFVMGIGKPSYLSLAGLPQLLSQQPLT